MSIQYYNHSASGLILEYNVATDRISCIADSPVTPEVVSVLYELSNALGVLEVPLDTPVRSYFPDFCVPLDTTVELIEEALEQAGFTYKPSMKERLDKGEYPLGCRRDFETQLRKFISDPSPQAPQAFTHMLTPEDDLGIILAIQFVRDLGGLCLRDARDYVEYFR